VRQVGEALANQVAAGQGVVVHTEDASSPGQGVGRALVRYDPC
jgi:hypothetical protein